MRSATGHADEKKRTEHSRGLLLIGVFKLFKAVLFFSMGVGVIHFLHKDLSDEVIRLAQALRFDTESHFVELLMRKVNLITPEKLKAISIATFAYSGIALTEGIGLLMEKVWAEYLTLILTIAFLPWEVYELARHPNLFRVGIMLINLAVLAYLVWLLRRKKQEKAGLRARAN